MNSFIHPYLLKNIYIPIKRITIITTFELKINGPHLDLNDGHGTDDFLLNALVVIDENHTPFFKDIIVKLVCYLVTPPHNRHGKPELNQII
jgi:hypothetical protein